MAPSKDYFADNKNVLLVNASKQEVFKLNENYKAFQRKLKLYWKIVVNKDEISEKLLQNCSVVVLPGSQTPYEENEIAALKSYIQKGGRVLVLLSESSSSDQCNVNVLLEEYGIVPKIDCLIRTHYYKYFHPKECYIGDSQIHSVISNEKDEIKLVYPFGCTMAVTKPSAVAFTSGVSCFPVDKPLGAIYYDEKSGGRLVAIGSGHMFSDRYLDQENNDKFREALMSFLTQQSPINFTPTDNDDIDLTEQYSVPDTAELAERPKLCLTDAAGYSNYVDYTKLFEHQMYSMNTSLVPVALKLYNELGVKHECLKIITPKFETPFPPLQPAVFPPAFRDLPPPPLELFDLDEAFSSVFSNLSQFTNKYLMSSDEKEDLDLFIKGCTRILAIEGAVKPFDVLYKIGNEIAKFKSIDTIK
nr:unnamed protein product [Callosobruchus chinensis]CAH7752819.1 unnamed protein product [Callosobruchus chinensis]